MSEDAFRAGSSALPPSGAVVPPAPPRPTGPRMPTGPSPAGGDRRRTSPWVFVTLVLLVLAVWWLAARVVDLQSRVETLESNQIEQAMPILPASTLPPPVDMPPLDSELARRLIRESVVNVFASDLPAEQRASWVRDPGDTAGRLAALGQGACAAGVQVVITELRFIDDDTAGVRIRFEGPGVPAGGNGVTFDGFVHRAPERWLVDVDMVDQVLDLAASYCN